MQKGWESYKSTERGDRLGNMKDEKVSRGSKMGHVTRDRKTKSLSQLAVQYYISQCSLSKVGKNDAVWAAE
jgi:hypothetical protein